MSFRKCNECGYIFNNRFYQEDNDKTKCPVCESYGKACSVKDKSNWDDEYKEQLLKLLEEAAINHDSKTCKVDCCILCYMDRKEE